MTLAFRSLKVGTQSTTVVSFKFQEALTPEYYIAITSLLHQYYIAITSLSHRYYIAITSLLHRYYIAITSLLHHYYITITSLLHQYYISITSILHRYYIAITSLTVKSLNALSNSETILLYFIFILYNKYCGDTRHMNYIIIWLMHNSYMFLVVK